MSLPADFWNYLIVAVLFFVAGRVSAGIGRADRGGGRNAQRFRQRARRRSKPPAISAWKSAS